MKRRKLKKLSLGRVTVADLSVASGGRRFYSDVANCSNSCSQDPYTNKLCTSTTQAQQQCGNVRTDYW